MIMKENKQIGFIYKNNESIDTILKDGDVVFEKGFLREKTSTTLPITFGGVGKDLKDYKVYGNTMQNSTNGINEWNSFNKEQTDNYKVLEDGTIQLINSSSSSNGYTRMSKTLKEMCPNLNVGDTVYLYIESTWYRKEIYSSSLGASGAWQNGRSRTLTQQMLDDYIILYGGYQTTSTIKIMITKGQYYDTYEPFTNGASPNPDYPQEIISCGDLITDSQDENYGKYKIPVNVNNVITNIYLNEPLRKIGEYSDYIDFINGKAVRKIRKIILDGSENWARSYGNNLFNLQHYLDDAMFIVGYGLSNYYRYNPVQSGINANTKNGEFALQSSYGGNVMIKNTDYTVINDFKAWLSTHNTEILYPLATPTEETITLPNIPTIDGNNTLNIETEITPSQVYIKYKSNE